MAVIGLLRGSYRPFCIRSSFGASILQYKCPVPDHRPRLTPAHRCPGRRRRWHPFLLGVCASIPLDVEVPFPLDGEASIPPDATAPFPLLATASIPPDATAPLSHRRRRAGLPRRHRSAPWSDTLLSSAMIRQRFSVMPLAKRGVGSNMNNVHFEGEASGWRQVHEYRRHIAGGNPRGES